MYKAPGIQHVTSISANFVWTVIIYKDRTVGTRFFLRKCNPKANAFLGLQRMETHILILHRPSTVSLAEKIVVGVSDSMHDVTVRV